MVRLTTLSRPLRGLHTSAYAAADARQITSDFLARLQGATGTAAGRSDASSSRHDAARGMLRTIGLKDLSVENEGRSEFKPNKIAPPHAYREENLYPADASRKNPRPPLMGPSTKVARQIDPFHIRQSNPLDHTLNPLMTFRFVNAFGKIRPRSETGLTWRSQRMVGKMVRRARAMGIVSRWTNLPRPGGLGEQDFNQR